MPGRVSVLPSSARRSRSPLRALGLQKLAEQLAEPLGSHSVAAFLEAHLDALRLLADDPARAKADVVAQLRTLTGQDLDPAVVDRAWDNLTFLADPLPATLIRSAEHAHAVGLLEDLPADDLAGLWDLDPLNRALRARDLPEVTP